MKEKILRFLRRIFKVHGPTLHARGTCWCMTKKRNCMTCQYGDFGDNSGPCRECSRSNNFIHYKEEK
jgi:hypothetical protein